MIKRCTKCDRDLPVALFSKDVQKRDGLRPSCKDCGRLSRSPLANERTRQWRRANRDKVRADKKRYYHANIEASRAKKREDYAKNREKRLAGMKRWRAAQPPEKLKYTGPVTDAQRRAKAAWKARNAAYLRADRAKRRAAELRALSPWANHFFMREAYALARLRSKIVGGKWVVDHIVPLRSKYVCGLHNEFNLQVIPEAENARKNNYRWPQMPDIPRGRHRS